MSEHLKISEKHLIYLHIHKRKTPLSNRTLASVLKSSYAFQQDASVQK